MVKLLRFEEYSLLENPALDGKFFILTDEVGNPQVIYSESIKDNKEVVATFIQDEIGDAYVT